MFCPLPAFPRYRPGHGWSSWRIPFGFALEAAFHGSHASTSAGAWSCFRWFSLRCACWGWGPRRRLAPCTGLNLLSSRLHVTSPSSESLSRWSAPLPVPILVSCYLLLRNAAERCGHGPMYAAGDSSGAVSIVTYHGESVCVAEDGQGGAMVLKGAGHHSGGVACVAFARNVETHRSHTHTHTHTHTHSSRMRVRARKHQWLHTLQTSCSVAPPCIVGPICRVRLAINRTSVCTFQASQSYLHPSCTLRVDTVHRLHSPCSAPLFKCNPHAHI